MLDMKSVSIVIPCRNEEKFIGKCIDSVIANDYPKDHLEILVVDGMSEDKSREIVESHTKRYPFIQLLDNPKKRTPFALNIGIKHTKGEIIMRMDAHATYDEYYITKCVKFLNEYKVDNVGGIWITVPRDDTLVGKAISNAFSHSFGIGNAYYRLGGSKEPKLVDTVPNFCCKKEVFDKIGLFNEELARGQDMEFSLRLKNAGGKTLLVPEIISYYYARSDLKSFFKHNFINGIWVIYPFKFTNIIPVSWRHLVPIAFVSSLIISLIFSIIFPIFLWLFLLIVCSYFLANLYFSSHIAIQEKNIRYLFIMPIIFAAFHLSYGMGSIFGLMKVSMSREFWKNLKSIIMKKTVIKVPEN